MTDSNNKRKFVQLNLDREKEDERILAEYIDYMNHKGINNKNLLKKALEKMMQEDSMSKVVKEAVKEANKEIICEVQDLKLMIKGLAGITITNEEDHELATTQIIGIDEGQITEDEIGSI